MATSTRGIEDGHTALVLLRTLALRSCDISWLSATSGIDEATLRAELVEHPETLTVATWLRSAAALELEPAHLIGGGHR